MPDNNILFSVTLPDGTKTTLSQEQYAQAQDKLFSKFPDAQVARVSSYMDNDDDQQDSDSYSVSLPDGSNTVLSAAQFRKNQEKLFSQYPDAQVAKISDMSDRYWRPKLEEAQAALEQFNGEHGSFMGQYEMYRDLIENRTPAQEGFLNENLGNYGELVKQRDALRDAVVNNPIVKRGRRQASEQAVAARDKYLDLASKAETGAERRDYKRAAKLQGDAAELFAAPGQYDKTDKSGFAQYMSDYGKGAINVFSDKDFWTRGLTQIARDIDLRGIRKKVEEAQNAKGAPLEEGDFERILTESEKAQLFSFYNLARAQAERANDLSSAYKAGTTAAESAGYMAEFLLSQGLANVAGKALSASANGFARFIGQSLMSDKALARAIDQGVTTATQSARVGREITAPVIQGLWHTGTQLSTLSTIASNLNQTNDAGELNGVGSSIFRGLADSLIENWSESFGNTIDMGFDAVGKGLGWIGEKTLGKTNFGQMARYALNSPFTMTLREAGFNGFIGEMLEEWAGNAVRLATGLMSGDEFKQFASIQQQLEMAASFAPMSLIGIPGHIGGAVKYKKELAKLTPQVKSILLKNGVQQADIDALFGKKWATSGDIAEALAPYAMQVAQSGSKADYKTILDFASISGADAFNDAVKEYQNKQARDDMRQYMMDNVGEQFWQNYDSPEAKEADGTPVQIQQVRVLDYADGTQRFIIGGKSIGEGGNKTYATVDQNGTHGFIDDKTISDGLESGQLTSDREMMLEDYLQERVDATKTDEEAQRMMQEEQRKIAAVKERLAADPHINVGTIEKPKIATVQVIPEDPNHIRALWREEEGSYESYLDLTWRQAAAYMGMPVESKTDAQIEEEAAAEQEQAKARKDKYNRIAPGTPITVANEETGYQEQHRFAKASYDENEGFVRIYVTDENGQPLTDEAGDEVYFPETMVQGLDQLAESAAAPVEPVAPEAPETQEPVQEAAVAKYTNEEGKVNQTAFFNHEPEEWAKWNDQRRSDNGDNTVQRLTAAIGELDSQITKAQKEWEKESNPDEADRKEETLKGLQQRRDRLNTILQGYLAQRRAAKEAEDAAKRAEFQKEVEKKKAAEKNQRAKIQDDLKEDAQFVDLAEQYQQQPKTEGAEETINVQGQEFKGHWVVAEATTPKPSHNPLNNYAPTPGYPIGKAGNTNHYDKDKRAQEITQQMSNDYDSRAAQEPIVATKHGIVISGNGRTQARLLAAQQGTDAKYKEYIKKYAYKWGLTSEQVEQYQNPILYFELDEDVEYTAQLFDIFNRSTSKQQGTVETAAKVAQMTNEELVMRLDRLFRDLGDSLDSLYNSPEKVNELLNILEAAGLFNANERARYVNGNGELNGAGEDLLNSVLFGAVFSSSEQAIRDAMADKSVGRAIAFAFPTLVRVRNLQGEFSIIDELTQAVSLLARAKEANKGKAEGAIEDYMNQYSLFAEGLPVEKATVQLLANLLNGKKYSALRSVLDQYIGRAEAASNGQMDMFTGEVEGKEQILRDVLDFNNINIQTYDNRQPGGSENAEVRASAPEQGGSWTAPVSQGNSNTGEAAAAGPVTGPVAEQNPLDVAKKVTEVNKRLKKWQKLLGNIFVIHADLSSVTDEAAIAQINEYDAAVAAGQSRDAAAVRGWFDPQTGTAHIYLPHLLQMSDVKLNLDQTILHEVIAHKGIRALFKTDTKAGKEKYNKFLDNVWELMGKESRDYFLDYVKGTEDNEAKRRAAVDEFLAHSAEHDTAIIKQLDANFWTKLADALKEFVNDALGEDFFTEDTNWFSKMLQDAMVAVSQQNEAREEGETLFSIKEGSEAWKANEQFNNELAKQIEGTLPANHTYRLGFAGPILRSAGIKNLPIEMEASRLVDKSIQGNHPFDLKELQNLPLAIQQPLAVFKSASRIGRHVILTPLKHGDQNFIAALSLGRTPTGFSIESIRSVYPKKDAGIIDWINEDLAEYIAPIFIKDYLEPLEKNLRSKPQSNSADVRAQVKSATKVVENFVNPSISKEKYDKFFGEGTYETDNGFKEKAEVVTKLDDKPAEGNVLFSHTGENGKKTLVGIHNISGRKLAEAIKTGGLANPSMAVIDLGFQIHEDYGDISLIAPASLIDSETGRNAGTYNGDAWTPTYPGVSKRMSDKGWDKFSDEVRALPEPFDHQVRNDWREYLEDDRMGSSLHWWFMQDTGKNPETIYNTSNLSEKDKAFIRSLQGKRIFGTDEDAAKAIDLYRRLGDQEQVERAGRKFEIKEGRSGQYRDWALARNEDIDAWGIWTVPVVDFIEKLRQQVRYEGTIAEIATYQAAEDYVRDNKLEDEFNTWLQSKEKQFGVKSVLFAGWTADGDRRYVPNTVENASRLMNREPAQNAYGNGGLSATRSLLLKRMESLEDIRKNRSELADIRGYASDTPEYKEATDNWFDVIEALSQMQKISDNEFSNIDYAEARLQEAILERDPIAYLNREYRYHIEKGGDFEKALKASLKEIKNLPAKYFETKFNRPVYLNEFAAAVVPTDARKDVVEELKKAGVPVYEYDDKEEGARQKAVIEASEAEGIRFSVNDYRDGKAQQQRIEEVTSSPEFKEWFKGSKVVDENGNPLVVYRGAGFDPLAQESGLGVIKPQAYFSPSKDYAQQYGPWVRAYFLNIQHPFDIRNKKDRELWMSMMPDWYKLPQTVTGALDWASLSAIDIDEFMERHPEYDGIVLDEGGDYQKGEVVARGVSYMPLKGGAQVKSADSNNGAFSRENPDVRFSKTDTPAFKAWFKDSKVVDENGEPLVVYHGTNEQFNTFEKKNGLRWVMGVPIEVKTGGFFFSDSKELAEEFAASRVRNRGGREQVMPVYLSIQKPADLSVKTAESEELFAKIGGYWPAVTMGYETLDKWWQLVDDVDFDIKEKLSGLGYDGIIFAEELNDDGTARRKSYFVPSSTQIKSAENNNGNYDAANPDIRFSISKQLDSEYMRAVEAGDMAKAQALVNRAAAAAGYTSKSDYQGSRAFNGAAPSANGYYETREQRKEAFDNGEFEDTYSLGDFIEVGLDNHDLQWQLDNPIPASARDEATLESIKNIRSVVSGKKKTIKMYRAVPSELKENSFRNGDWITPSRLYAQRHIELQDWMGGRIIEQEVSVDDIWWNGDDINEWGFDDGKNYAYKNTENNRKLLEPITRDDAGNVIPLSERFNTEREDIRFSIKRYQDFSRAQLLNKQPGKEYADENELLFSMTKNNRATITAWLKKREDLSEAQRNAFVNWLADLNNAKLQLATAKWFTQGAIRLPEDMPKVEQAVSVADKAKVDPLQYGSPMELLEKHADFKASEKRINPDEVPTLHKAKEFKEMGLVIYDVDDSEESRQNMRKIINSHFGKGASPWCLLQGDGNGNLTSSSTQYWRHYNAYPKQVAFKDGKLLSFSANDSKKRVWWDRQDKPHDGVPVSMKMPNDELGRSAIYEYNLETGEMGEPTDIHRGNKQNGTYETWTDDGKMLQSRAQYKDGKRHGITEVWHRSNGKLWIRETYNNGVQVDYESWYEDGKPWIVKHADSEGRRQGEQLEYHENGQLALRQNYKNNLWHGLKEKWNSDGVLIEKTEFKDGRLHGKEERWHDNGKKKSVTHFENGERSGLMEEWYENGTKRSEIMYHHDFRVGVSKTWHESSNPKSEVSYTDEGQPDGVAILYYDKKDAIFTREHWKDGDRHGLAERFFDNGQLQEREHWKNGVRDGVSEKWFRDGVLYRRAHYTDGELDGLFERFHDNGQLETRENYKDGMREGVVEMWGSEGLLLYRWLYENDKPVRDLGLDGPSVYDDATRFSVVTDRAELEWLNKQPTVTLYRAMELIDGELYPPMSQKEPNAPEDKGKRLQKRKGSKLGQWEKSDENPEKAYQKEEGGPWYFDLKKIKGSDVNGVLYNPYFHLSASPLNDQFSAASTRPNLVVVACEVPVSELAGGYKAEKANDSTGAKDWHSGTVTAQLGEGRQVVLSRYAKPYRIVPDAEVAEKLADKIKAKDIIVPVNVVTPSLRKALEARGVKFSDSIEEVQTRFSMVNKNQDVFVSNAQAALDKIQMGKATPEQWVAMLEKNGGLKAGEDKWLGLSDWLKASDKKTITKQEIADFIAEHKIKIEEVRYQQLEYTPAFKRLQKEFLDNIVADPEDMWEEADSRLQQFYVELEEKYGEDWEYEMTREEEAIESSLQDDRDRWGAGYDAGEEGFNQMVEKYGDDFRMAFTYNGADLLVSDREAAAYFLDAIPIDEIRESYQTKGLENNREIALTVPTVESYRGALPEVHFADEHTDGKTVAWIRFGDAKIKRSDEEINERKEAQRAFVDEMKAKYGEDALQHLTPEERSRLIELIRNANNTSKRVLMIDEIQSQRHQDARERGYKNDPATIKQLEALTAKYNELHAEIEAISKRQRDIYVEMTEEAKTKGLVGEDGYLVQGREAEYREMERGNQELQELSKRWSEAFREEQDVARQKGELLLAVENGVPTAPFEKNWHELAFKRMLRLAAEEGYDYVAWTTGEQQSARYNLSQVVSEIAVKALKDGEYRVVIEDKYGSELPDYSGSGKIMNAQELSQLVGKDLATKLITGAEQSRGLPWSGKGNNPEYYTVKGDDLKIGGEGMKGFYDEILPRFINKYGKKWGISTEDQLISLTGGALLEVHTIPVTDEMRESVMEGQTMFSKTGATYQGSLFTDDGEVVNYQSEGGLPKQEGRRSLVERTYQKSGVFSFMGKEKIKTAGDVAYIFKQLETAAVENSFIVYLNNGVPTILHTGIGDFEKVFVDTSAFAAGLNDFTADEVYMVHNHPSGNLRPSLADMNMMATLQKIAGKIPVKGVIIDTVSGQYSLINRDGLDSIKEGKVENAGNNLYEVKTFDKLVFSPEYRANLNAESVNNPDLVAAYLSAHRLGNCPKVGALLLDSGSRVTGNLVMNENEVTTQNSETLARQIVNAAVHSLADKVVLFGDFGYNLMAVRLLNVNISTFSGGQIGLADVVRIEGNNTLSMVNETLAASAEPKYEGRTRFSMVSEENRAIEGLLDRYDNQDGSEEYPWIDAGEDFLTMIERELPYTLNTKPIYSLIDEWRRLDKEDTEEGRRDFSGGEKDEVFEHILARMRDLASGEQEDTRFSQVYQTENGFISNAELAVESIPMEKATPEQWLKMIESRGGLKAGEDKWLGLSDWIKAQDVKTFTKQQVLDYIAQNRIQIEETRYMDADDIPMGGDEEWNKVVTDKYGPEILDAFEFYPGDGGTSVSFRDEDKAAEVYRKLQGEMGYKYILVTPEEDSPYSRLDMHWMKEVAERIAEYGDDQMSKKHGHIINNTRLDYTTAGLFNKREIALTVPAIEPWNENDSIHFGDAGNGRAIAWIRFGDAEQRSDSSDEAQNARRLLLSYEHDIEDAKGAINRGVSGKWLTIHQETIREAEQNKKQLLDAWPELTDAPKRVLFIDEIQSKRHQEGREFGYSNKDAYKSATVGEFRKFTVDDEQFEEAEVIGKNGRRLGKITKNEDGLFYAENADGTKVTSSRRTVEEALEAMDKAFTVDGIPEAPFEKNWHELAMKRMLRLAAEEGYDYMVWTTGEQQAERYNIGNYVSSINCTDVADGEREYEFYLGDDDSSTSVVTDDDGIILRTELDGGEQVIGKPLSELVGKEVAIKMMQMEPDDTIEDIEMTIGGEGMKGFYDDMLVRYMNKYGKRWGVKVEDMELHNILKEKGDALVVHSVRITPEMKASVMEGQTMFSRVNQAYVGGIGSIIGPENVTDFYMDVYAALPKEMRSDIANRAVDGDLNFRNVMSEYLSHLAAAGDDETGALGMAETMLKNYVGDLDDRAARYILWRGDRRMDPNDVLETASDQFVRSRIGIGIEENTAPDNSIEGARANTDTNPTDAQKKAGNYRHGHLTLDGYNISLENPKGSVRSGKDAKGNEWSVTMNNDYGYIRMTEGVDGDHIDVFLSDNPSEGNVFVIDQVNPENGEFDEHKVMYGFETAEQARDAYLANYSPGWKGLGTITEVSKEEFKKWIESSHRKTKPFADYKSVNALGAQSEEIRFSTKDNLNAADAKAEAAVDAAKETMVAKKKEMKKDLLTMVKAMNIQKEYDRGTVDALAALVRDMMKDEYIDSLSRREVSRLLGIIRTSVGKSPKTVKKNADILVELVIDNLLKREREGLNKLTKTTGTKVNATGVEVQGELDLQGQKTLKAYKEGITHDIGTEGDDETMNTLYGMRARLADRLESKDDAVRKDAEAEDAGLALAIEYKENVKALLDEEKELESTLKDLDAALKDGDLSQNDYAENVKATKDALRENHVDQIEAIRSFRQKMQEMLSGSVEAKKAFNERDKERIEAIHHLANSDMSGRSADTDKKPDFKDKLANSPIVRFFLAPLGTFDQMLRLFGRKNVAGEGYLWNKFMRQWQEASGNAYIGQRDAKAKLDEKVSEIFGRPGMKWSDLFDEERGMGNATIKWLNAEGTLVEHELNQGQLLYILMVDKMADGRMKLRRMGIMEEDVAAIRKNMDERFIKLADWLQEEYLVELRNKYNAVHERLFGASMAAIDNYFPLVINKRSLVRNEDIAAADYESLPSTTTGSIIKRRRNSKPLDLLNADAFLVVLNHIDQMEQWAAFAEFNKDINTLLSYKRFRNQVQNMASVYGSGTTLWQNFKDVCRIAGGAYHPTVKKDSLDSAAVNLAKGVTSAKISFRVYTAIKQLLSMPAFVADANVVELAKNMVTPWKAWNWAMENLPLFEKRWKSRIAGDTRLMTTEMDWKIFRSRLYDMMSKMGMTPNAFVDALTVAIGSHSIYQTRYNNYIKEGYSEEVADKKAKQDATTLYNETQQSSESAFVSTTQLDRTVFSTAISVFRNSSMGYQRQAHDAIRNIGRLLQKGYKEQSIEFMTKQLVRDGLTEEQAKTAAEKRYNKALTHNAVRVGTFAFLVQFAWNLGSSLAYLLFGDDDDKKEEMLMEAFKHALVGGFIEGLAGGNVASEALNMIVKGESLRNYDPTLLPILSDMKRVYAMMGYDKVAGINELVNLGIQAGIGVNPQTLTDAVVAVVDACDGDLDTSREAMLLIMRVLQVPASQVDQIYIDELGVTAERAKRMSYAQMAERYARYKLNKNAPLTSWAYPDELKEKRLKAHKTSFKKKVNERKKLKQDKNK